MGSRVGALVLFAEDVERTVAFYRLLGLPLEEERHDDGPVHYACDLDGCHFAVFPGIGPTRSPGHRSAGATFPGITVDAVDEAVEAARAFGADVLQEPSPYPWGVRAVIVDPDGRAVEVYEPV